MSQPIPLEEQFALSPKEVRTLLKFSRSTFDRRIAPAVSTGEIAHYWIGNQLRIVRTSLFTYLEHKREGSNNG